MDERRRALIAAAALALLLAGSASTAAAGDFGRPDPAPQLFAQRPAGLSVTDEEREMHDRLWRFFALSLGPGRTVRLVGKGRPVDPEAARSGYWRALSGTAFASARTRYRRLADDVRADLGTLPQAFASVCAVEEIDRQRRIAAQGLGGIEAGTHAALAKRLADNAETIGRFAAALSWRLDAYGYALDHLLVDAPYDDAVAVDGLLAELETWVVRAARGDFCLAPPIADAPRPRYGPGAAPR